jgi:DNA repair exonuclease SbcCD ATPase subunit
MGIFDVVCPSCGEVNSVDTGTCSCGHIFNAVTGSYEAAQLTLQEEEAYFEYIKARLKQLKNDKEFAKSAITANPGNKDKIQELETIRTEIAELKAQYEQQQTQIKATQKVNADLREQFEREAAAARARAQAEANRLKKEKQKTEALRKAKEQAEQERSRQLAEAEKKANEKALRKKKQEQVEKQRIAREKQEAEQKLQQQQAAAEERKRQQQEIKQAAAQLAEAKKAAKVSRSIPKKTVFNRAAILTQGRKAGANPDPLKALTEVGADIEQPAMLTCPICTAELPLTAVKCGCGYVFEQQAADMPALSTGDFFAAVQPDADQKTQQCPVCTAEVSISAKSCNCGYQFPSGETSMPGLSLDGNLD